MSQKTNYFFFLLFSISLGTLFLIPWATHAFSDTNLPPLQTGSRFYINLILVFSTLAYGFIISNRGITDIPKLWWIVFGVLGLTLCFMRPVFSGDLYDYLLSGRIFGVYHKNPYLTAGMEFPNDMYRPFSVWVKQPYNYGVSWTLVQWIAPTFFAFSFGSGIFFHKLIMYLFMLGSAVLVYQIARQIYPGKEGWYLAAYALNPNMIVHVNMDGHNDIYMVFWMLLSVYLFLRNKPLRAVAAATVSVYAKYVSFFLVSILILWGVRKLKGEGVGVKIRFIFKAFLMAAGVSFLLLAPFVGGWKGMVGDLALAKNWFYSNSIPYAVWAGLAKTGIHLEQGVVQNFFRIFFVVNILAAHLWLMLKPNLEARDVIRAAAWMFIAFHLSYAFPFFGSHLNLTLPFLLLSDLPNPRLLLLLFSSSGVFAYFKRLSFLFISSSLIYAMSIPLFFRTQRTLK